MKKTSVNSRKLRYGGVTAALTALIIAAVIVGNLIFSMLASRFTWYIDMTPDMLFTLSDECIDLIRDGDDEFGTASAIERVDQIREESGDPDISINIIFCDEADNIVDDTTLRYVHNTALELQSEFPDHIKVKYHNVYRNPSAVSKYKSASTSTITPSNVIVEFGTEFRVYSSRTFYSFDEDGETAWAYNGEKKLTAGILAVTRTESPIACITINHGESVPEALRASLMDSGYIVQDIDLLEEEIPEDCRLIVIYNPMSDFKVNDGMSVDEISKLDDFLDQTNSLMAFIGPDSNGGKRLDALEDYLEEWGIVFDRNSEGMPHIVEESADNSKDSSRNIFAQYANYGLGASITKDMRSSSYPRTVVFPNAMSISFAPTYQLVHDSDSDFDYAQHTANSVTRSIYDVFTTSPKASAYAGGILAQSATEANPLKLMTISEEQKSREETNYSSMIESSYVIAFGSTDFALEKCLGTDGYGNNELLLSLCRYIGHEPVPVGIDMKPFADYDIDSITTAAVTQYTVILTAVPAVAAICAGAVVLIRRKNR